MSHAYCGKCQYATTRDALSVAGGMRKKCRRNYRIYWCKGCQSYHVSKCNRKFGGNL